MPGRDVRPAAAVELERDPERRLGARPDQRRLASRRPGPGSAPSARRRMSFSVGRRSVIRIPCGNRRTMMPCASSRPPRSSSLRTQTKLPGRRAARRSRRRRAPSRTRSRSATSDAMSKRGSRSAAAAMRAAGAGDRRRRPPRLEHGGRRGRCDGVADPERGVAERLRHRAQHDQVRGTRRARGRPTRRRTRRTPRRRRPRRPGGDARARRARPPASPRPVGLSGLQRQIRLAPSVARRPARRRRAGSRSGRASRSAGRSTPSGPGARYVRAQSRMRSSAPAPTTTCSQPTLAPGLRPDVRRRRLAQLAVEARRDTGSASRSSPRAGPAATPGQRRRVLVELQHLRRGRGRGARRPPRPSPPRRRARSRRAAGPRPGRAAERRRRRLLRVARIAHDAHQQRARRRRRGAAAPRPARSGRSRAPRPRRPAAVARTTWSGFMNISSPSPPEERASPPVGRTCVAPAA